MITISFKNLPIEMRALKFQSFRLYFAGQAISIMGSWIQQVALSWLVYKLSGSSALLGISSFCALSPQLILGPIAGAWVDKLDKKKWLIRVQALLAIQAFTLSLLVWAGWINTALIVAMSLILGILTSFDTPLRQSLITSFVASRDDIPNALALNAMLYNAGRFLGPPIAGLLVGVTSESACFAINGMSFLALIFGLLRVQSGLSVIAQGSVGAVFKEGVIYAWQTQSIRMLIFILIALNITASAYAVLLPVFAQDVFSGDASLLGWLWGAAGAGSLLSTIFLATRQSLPSVLTAVFAGVAISTASLLCFALITWLPLALLSMLCLGFGISVSNVGINMLLQSMTPEQFRGRIVSFFTSARFGFDALGGLLAGFIAVSMGAGRTLLVEGCVLLLFLIYLIKRLQWLTARLAETRGKFYEY